MLNGITLYRASPMIVDKPIWDFSEYKSDFGVGFYCTEIQEQAVRWMGKRFGSNGYINRYTFTPIPDLLAREFPDTDEDWFVFIYNARKSTYKKNHPMI